MSPINKSRMQTALQFLLKQKKELLQEFQLMIEQKQLKQQLIQKQKKRYCFTRHVFPLVARQGGVLERAGHTEASVDIAKLSKLNPSSVICEVMNEDGRMARLNDLFKFSKNIK